MKQLDQIFTEMLSAKIITALLSGKNWIAAITLAPIIAFIERHIFDDWTYLPSLMILVLIDFSTGVAAAWKYGEAITSKGWRNTVIKIVQYSSFLIVTHVIVNLEINGEKITLPVEWITEGAYIFLIAIEIKSVYENLTKMNSNLDFLKPVIQKLEQYLFSKKDKDGQL
jgi:phage-related holin